MHDVKSRDRGNLEKSGEGQGGERSLEGEEGKPTGGPRGGNRREARARHPKRLSEESTEAERRKTG